jgi:putative cell wall-binding protein
MRRYASAIVAVLLATGVGYAVHAHDETTTNNVIVQTYNSGFVDGTCAGSTTVAKQVYHFTCPGDGS